MESGALPSSEPMRIHTIGSCKLRAVCSSFNIHGDSPVFGVSRKMTASLSRRRASMTSWESSPTRISNRSRNAFWASVKEGAVEGRGDLLAVEPPMA